jgi:hypothetical protein
LKFDRLPAAIAVQLSYDVLLDRAPDPAGLATYVPQLASGAMTNRELVQFLRGSAEFETGRAFSADMLGPSLHSSRCRFIQSLPRARQIVDLGGTSLGDPRGALVILGYPYAFDSLVIVDLPPDDRHELYHGDSYETTETDRGPVSYRYHSMVDLSGFADSSVDMVYSGQSIEHVTPDEGAVVLKEVFRILRPGGHLALDTPNGRVTRLQQDGFIDPDHKIEYTWPQLSELITSTGFEIEWRKGLNYAGQSVSTGRFDIAEVAGNRGLFDAIDECYLLAVVARKP